MSVSISKGLVRVGSSLARFVKSPNFSAFDGTKPKIAVIHFTYGGSALSSAQWFTRADVESPVSAHVVIDRDGTIIQCVSFEDRAWHAGKSSWRDRHGKHLSGLNNHSFGIELANWGPLVKTVSGWKSHSGVPIADPVLAEHKNGNPSGAGGDIGWEPYPEAQVNAAAALVRALANTYGVDEIVGHDDIAPTRKWDPGPAFDMAAFRIAVFGGTRGSDTDNVLTVSVDEGLNLRNGPGQHFASQTLLPAGTRLRPEQRQGRWLYVTVLKENGSPLSSGWVHEAYVA